MKSFFKVLFEYNHHYNQLLTESFLQKADQIPLKAQALLSHMVNAHNIWNNRIEAKPMKYGVWQEHLILELKGIDFSNFEETLHIMDAYDLEKVINYSNSTGKSFRNNIKDMLFHVINHSTYHRGQIAFIMRQHGLEPISSDYIFYKR